MEILPGACSLLLRALSFRAGGRAWNAHEATVLSVRAVARFRIPSSVVTRHQVVTPHISEHQRNGGGLSRIQLTDRKYDDGYFVRGIEGPEAPRSPNVRTRGP
jgi:hypothetical protein